MTSLAIRSLGCARNEVDSEELAARFAEAGFDLVNEADQAEVVVVNTCGFIEAAKAESIDEILSAGAGTASGRKRTVIAAGCLAERYGAELAASLPEADAVVGFDDYDHIAEIVQGVMAGIRPQSHQPADRRRLLPLAPAERFDDSQLPSWVPSRRKRLDGSPLAPLKIASGCDRRCAFCAIPSFRGAFRSRLPADIVREAHWLAEQGVKELFLVSENTTSYGKDLSGTHALEDLLGDLATVDGIDWIRLSYLQPAELRPSLIDAIASTPKVVTYFDLPFQHASASVLRRMRRFGDAQSFLDLLAAIRTKLPQAGIRSNVIVGFPGETDQDVATLTQFLGEAGLDAIGVFAYSDEEGTEAAGLDAHLDQAEIAARTSSVAQWADTVTALRAMQRIGSRVEVLVEGDEDAMAVGRAAQQGPEDGRSYLRRLPMGVDQPVSGQILRGRVVDSDGVDWIVELDHSENGPAFLGEKASPGPGYDRIHT